MMKTDSVLTQMKKGLLEFCILALIVDQESYGYELVRKLGEWNSLVISEGTIYPLLSRLKKEGKVETVWRESSTGRPRKYYRITREGQEVLQTFKQQWEDISNAVRSILKEV